MVSGSRQRYGKSFQFSSTDSIFKNSQDILLDFLQERHILTPCSDTATLGVLRLGLRGASCSGGAVFLKTLLDPGDMPMTGVQPPMPTIASCCRSYCCDFAQGTSYLAVMVAAAIFTEIDAHNVEAGVMAACDMAATSADDIDPFVDRTEHAARRPSLPVSELPQVDPIERLFALTAPSSSSGASVPATVIVVETSQAVRGLFPGRLEIQLQASFSGRIAEEAKLALPPLLAFALFHPPRTGG